MRNMFKIIAGRLKNNEALVLVSVVASSGAAPRGAGARMLVGQDGRITGTIGGGAVEYRSEHIAAEVLREKKSGERDFSLTRDDVQNLGMICGGAVSVFFHYIPAGDAQTAAICREAEKRFETGGELWLVSDLSDGGRMGLYSRDGGAFGIDLPDWAAKLMTRRPVRTSREGRELYIEQINSPGRVWVFGCGHVAQELVPALSRVGFRCVALDDRPEFASKSLFPEAEDVRLIDFGRVADFVSIGPEDYVCVMTRGHAFDAVVQAQVLKTPACYIGVIGSAAKKAGVFRKLYEQGFTEADTQRITSPIGLDIKAETPAEIAVSIAAQLIELRAKRNEK